MPTTDRSQQRAWPVGRPLIRVDSVPSTMDLAEALARDGASSGTAVIAALQTAGRGRAGRVWDAEPGASILLSFIHHTSRPRAQLGPVSLLLGLAVAETVEAFVPGKASIKWPNDVLENGRKIAGILVVNKVLPNVPGTVLIAGVGLNVNNRAGALPEPATSLAIALGGSLGIDAVLDVLCDRLSNAMTAFEEGREGDLLSEIADRLAFRDEPVRIEDGPRVVEGVVRGIDATGALLLERKDGEAIAIVAGELTRGPRPQS